MAESKIIIQVLLDDKASDPLKKVESGLSGVNNETKKFNEHEKERERLQKRIIKATSKENIELKQLELRLQMANKRATETAKARINAAEGQDMFAKSVSRTTGALKGNRAQSGLNNAILIELGRTASDSQFGFQGMANNIGRLVELGQEFTRTGGGGILSALKTLGKSILGTGGILIAIQLLISFLPKLQEKFKELRGSVFSFEESFKNASKTIAGEIGKFEAYVATLKDANTSQREFDQTILAIEKDFPRLAKQFELAGIPLSDIKNQTEEATKITDAYRESIVDLALSRASATAIEEQASKTIQARLDAEAKVREGVGKGWFRSNQQFKDLAEARVKFEELLAKNQKQRLLGSESALFQNLKKIFSNLDKEEERLQERVGFLSDTYEVERQEIKSVNELKSTGLDLTVLNGQASIETENLITDNLEQNVNARTKITEKEYRIRARQLRQTAAALRKAADIFGEQTAANKALSIASATIDTYASADLALKTYPPPFGAIAAAANIAIGLKNVKEILSVRVPKEKPVPSAALGGGSALQAPDFNIVGASGQSQLAQTIAGAEAQPVRAYVVGKDVSTQQELDRNITNTASFG